MAETLKARLTEAMKAAMRAQDKPRLSAIRLMLAEIKRVEIDERIEIDDTRVLALLDKMGKQRRDAITAYRDAGRDAQAAAEAFELDVIGEFLPAQLDEAEILALIDRAVSDTGATGPAGMGQVMGVLKPQLQGRADMAAVSRLVKQRLA